MRGTHGCACGHLRMSICISMCQFERKYVYISLLHIEADIITYYLCCYIYRYFQIGCLYAINYVIYGVHSVNSIYMAAVVMFLDLDWNGAVLTLRHFVVGPQCLLWVCMHNLGYQVYITCFVFVCVVEPLASIVL